MGLAEEISSANKVNALLKLITAEDSLPLTVPDAYSVLGVLSSCGFFDTPEHKSYAEGFVPCSKREFVYETDIYYPLHLWRGKYGISFSAAEKFGSDIAKRLIPEKGSVQRKEPKRRKGASEEQYYSGNDNVIVLDDRLRHYYGLAPFEQKWDKLAFTR